MIMASIIMVPPLIIDILDHHSISVFGIPLLSSIMIGISFLYFGSKKKQVNVNKSISSSIFVLISFTLVASIPFRMCDPYISFTDSFFEAMSGITTTGATVFSNLEEFPRSILLWRSLLHAVGGIGIIIFSLIFLDIVDVINLEENDSDGKTTKLHQTAYIYVTLIILCTVSFYISGMSKFDAFCHACSTVATAGFANYDASFAAFNSPTIEIVTIIFLILSALPFHTYTQFLKSGKPSSFKTEQIYCFLLTIIGASIFATFSLYNHIPLKSLEESVRQGTFIVSSMITTTGFGIIGFEEFEISSLQILVMMLMFIGGCTGSSAGGIKTLRLLILLKTLKRHIMQTVSPSESTITIDGKAIDNDFIFSISAFFFAYIVMFASLCLGLSLTGLDFITSISGAAASLTNSGPGLGSMIGPSGNYGSFPIVAKWIYIIGMFLGRLEIIMVITLFTIIAKHKEADFD